RKRKARPRSRPERLAAIRFAPPRQTLDGRAVRKGGSRKMRKVSVERSASCTRLHPASVRVVGTAAVLLGLALPAAPAPASTSVPPGDGPPPQGTLVTKPSVPPPPASDPTTKPGIA